ncbi:hypothetical protein JOQ06_008055 [Pogonophryne albipinna]|uniref:HAT C-terminal dimerisation domain-containing protein n=1 Tax=Pogonophryne albipinna TaxID=1090488 RepID=A0AAD6AJH4_9TELE|nr:hypothetical protein JOQ06_008055 [Pogonophryne albipinna]
MYSVMADEARDHHTEQLAVCVRYVTMEGTPREAFLGLHKLDTFDAKSIADGIEAVLQSHNLGDLMCVAQTYDGAAVMSGAVGGVQARFRERHPEAVYVHCYAHELNLVLCHTCKAIPEAVVFFDLLETLHNTMGKPGEICKSCREQPSCHSCLSQDHEDSHSPRDPVKSLQAEDDLHADLRTEPGAEEVFKSTMTICEEHHIQLPVGPRQKQKRLDGFVVESACGATSNPTTPGEFRGQLYYPCLDRMIQELNHRFSDVGEELMSGIQACNPTTATFLSEDALKSLATHYKIQLKSEELLVAKHFFKRRLEKEKVPDIATVFQMLDSDMFPTLKAVLQVALTIPVSSCSCERSFSAFTPSAHMVKEHYGPREAQ